MEPTLYVHRKMNWEAFLIIGLFSLVLGTLLYLPAWIWAKRRISKQGNSNVVVKVTKSGFVFFTAFVVVLIGGLSQEHLAPDSELGKFVKTSSGRLVVAMVIGAVFWLAEIILKRTGIDLVEKKET